jgi:hypothetical protein
MEDGQAEIKRTVLTELLEAERLVDVERCSVAAFLLAVVIVRVDDRDVPSRPDAPKDQA